MADEGENRYVANQATIGINPVVSTAIVEDNAHPRYIDDAQGEQKLFLSASQPLQPKASKGFADTIAPRPITDAVKTAMLIAKRAR